MKHTLQILALTLLPLTGNAQCTISVDLGNDTTFCQGQSLQLNAGSHESYLWDNGSTNPTRFVSQAGTYTVMVGELGENIIVNGDFEAGNTSFSTEYSLGSGGAFGLLTNESTYAISSSPSLVHNNFPACADHTSGIGTQMMIVNGANIPNDVWCEVVAVDPNTDYQFKTWVTSALNDPTVANLQFSINSVTLGSVFSPPPTGCTWVQFAEVWNSGAEVNAEICIVNQNTAVGGNDFALDDISFAPICYADDEITVGTFPQPVITATPNVTVCSGDPATLTASSVTNGLTYNWTPGNLATASVTVSPNTSTVYSVTAESEDGCPSNVVSRSVIVNPTPVAGIFINGNDTICAGWSNILDGTSTVNNSTFLWSPGGQTTPQVTVFSTPPSSTYTLTVTSPAGCASDSTVTISVIPPLTVDISGITAICDGNQTVLTADGNIDGMTYSWSPGGIQDDELTVSEPGTYTVTGNFFFCDAATDQVTVTLDPSPVVTVPADSEICPGEPVFAQVSSDQPGSTFEWQPGDLSGTANTIVTTETVTYTVTATNNGCVSEPQTFTVFTSAACSISVPNVFTPNNDKSNDFFELINFDGIKSIEVVIVNRWGNTVAEFDKPDFKWDGMDSKGNELTAGVYFYTIKAVTKADEVFEKQGNIQLSR